VKIKILVLLSILNIFFLSGCDDDGLDVNTDISVPVSVAQIKLKSIEAYISTTGTVKSIREVTLKSEMSGAYNLIKNKATGKPFALGDTVKKGQLIIKFEDEEYENDVGLEPKNLSLDIAENNFKKQQSFQKRGSDP